MSRQLKFLFLLVFVLSSLPTSAAADSIEVIIAGTTNSEVVQLEIDGSVVQTWANLGDGAYSGNFVTRTYELSPGENPARVRLNFINDFYDPTGTDRNVRVDAVIVRGQRFEAEGPSVFSTGSWLPSDGVVPGFRESEYLHTNGYFEFTIGSEVEVRAAGSEGDEIFQLKVNGEVVAERTVTEQVSTYTFNMPSRVRPEQVRIEFVNDLYVPGTTDRNLIVDSLSIDGTVYETEHPSVFSTGTWKPGDGIVPGYRQSEVLHSNGYFQFDSINSPSISVGVYVLENAAYPGRVLGLNPANNNVRLVTSTDIFSQWRVLKTDGGVVLQSVATGQFLRANGAVYGNVVGSDVLNARSTWIVGGSINDGFALRNSATQGFLDGDPGEGGWNVEQSPAAAADDFWIASSFSPIDSGTRGLPFDQQITFGTFGDYGTVFGGTPQVANLVRNLAPDILVTLGDARYYDEAYTDIHGLHYCEYLYNVQPGGGCSGGSSLLNRFFPAVGNHDYTDGGGLQDYLDYFDLPGDLVPVASNTNSELYYDFMWGPVHFFVIDTQAYLNDPTSRVIQTQWLSTQMQNSNKQWQIVVLHHPPYSSGVVGPSPALRIPFQDWGADLVLAGHDHSYERLKIDGLDYVVSGLGGESIFGLGSPVSGSITGFDGNYGINLITATESRVVCTFVDVDGMIRDVFVIE